MKALPVVAPFEVRFNSLFSPGRALAFPCDARGRVDLDALSERARNNYLFARATVGREHAMPCICPLATPEPCLHH
jgi:hypothetical protein